MRREFYCVVATTYSGVDGIAALSVGGGQEGRSEDDGGTHVDCLFGD